MAVYYKFKSAKDFDSVPIDGHFIMVGNLKERIFESKQLGKGTDFDLIISNAQTGEEYLDEATLVAKNTSVLVRRVPGRPRMRIITKQEEPKDIRAEYDPASGNLPMAEFPVARFPEETDCDEFGSDLYAVPEVVPVQLSNQLHCAPVHSKVDEDNKLRALIDTPALDWQMQPHEGFGGGRGFGRGIGGRMIGGRGFGRGGFESKTPPHGYVCHRCKLPGHFIQHCPTNGDPNYEIKRVRPPTGIPKSMLMATPDGSYTLPSGAIAVFKPNEAAFDKEVDGLPSSRSVNDLPPEFLCPLCKEVMKDAALTSKCCFTSFCDKCIRNHIITNLFCVCGASNTLADDLLPNKTLRDSIKRILESNNSTVENAGSSLNIQDMESARCSQPKASSPTLSATSKSMQLRATPNENTPNIKEPGNEGTTTTDNTLQQSLEKGKTARTADICETTSTFIRAREGSFPQADMPAGKIKKKKRTILPANGTDPQWRTTQELGAEYMMPHMAPTPPFYDPYWGGGMQLGMDGHMTAPYHNVMPYMNYAPNYAPNPFEGPHGAFFPQGPFVGQGHYSSGFPPQSMGTNPTPPNMSKEEFEARKTDMKRKQENERHGRRRESFMDQESGREVNNNRDVSSMKAKSRLGPQSAASAEHHHHRLDSSSKRQQWREREPETKPERGRGRGQDWEPHHKGERRQEREDNYERDHRRRHV